MKVLFAFFLILFSSIILHSQTTAIPDVNFEQALINLGFDIGPPDGFVRTDSIKNVTNLNVSSLSISSLDGIEDFASLTDLICHDNDLTELDISQNTLLTQVRCHMNELSELDVSNSPDLYDLSCSHNELTELNVSKNTSLAYLQCQNNKLTELGLTNNDSLVHVYCTYNQLSALDVSKNESLTNLFFEGNQLSFIDLSKNVALGWLSCGWNKLNGLDLTQNSALTVLHCNNNQLTSLNVEKNSLLTRLNCGENWLSCLNVKNGNNINFSEFTVAFNTPLTCISVDSLEYSVANWTPSENASFSEDCTDPCAVGIEINDAHDFSLYPNPTSGEVSVDLGRSYEHVDVSLVNYQGQVLNTQDFNSVNYISIDIIGPSGIYFMRLEASDGNVQTIKVIKR